MIQHCEGQCRKSIMIRWNFKRAKIQLGHLVKVEGSYSDIAIVVYQLESRWQGYTIQGKCLSKDYYGKTFKDIKNKIEMDIVPLSVQFINKL